MEMVEKSVEFVRYILAIYIGGYLLRFRRKKNLVGGLVGWKNAAPREWSCTPFTKSGEEVHLDPANGHMQPAYSERECCVSRGKIELFCLSIVAIVIFIRYCGVMVLRAGFKAEKGLLIEEK